MQTYQLQETKTFNVVLLIPCTFIYLLKITKKNSQDFPRCDRSWHLISCSGTKYNTKKNQEPNTNL